MRSLALVLLVGLLLGLPEASQAQWRYLFEGAEDLTKSDIEMMRQAARDGLEGKEAGDRVAWENPETGHKGVVILLEKSQTAELECRRVRHVTQLSEAAKELSLTSKICRAPGGDWKVYE